MTNSKLNREVTLIFISGDKTGRVLSYNPQTKEVRVLLNGLSFANGIALSQDASFLLIAETATCRILRHWLQPNKTKTSVEIFMSPLPRPPDNIKPSPRGGFWVAQYSRRERIIEWVSSLPTWVRECIIWLPLDLVNVIYSMFRRWDGESLALRVSEEGEVLEMLEDFGDKMVKYVSEVKEFNGSLWIGSVVMPHVGIYKL